MLSNCHYGRSGWERLRTPGVVGDGVAVAAAVAGAAALFDEA